MELNLRRFDITSITYDKVVVLIGKRETGKSFLVRDLMYFQRDIPIGTVISPTEGANKFFGNIVPPIFIHDEYTPAVLDNVVRRQKLVMKESENRRRLYGSCGTDPRAFLVLDDCMYDNTWINDKNVRLLFMNGRHYKVMFIITMQYPLGIPPSLRTNIDYVFILRENLIKNRKRIYENYAGMFPTYDVFSQVMDQCTENFECLVINNNAKSNRLEDQVFWYKAEQRPLFRMCSPECWALSQECAAAGDALADEDGSDGEGPAFDAGAAKPKRAGPQVLVRKNLPAAAAGPGPGAQRY